MKAVTTIERIVLWLGRLLGVLNLPIAFIAVIDLASAVLLKDVPETSEQWRGFLTAIAALAGAGAGLTIKSDHPLIRKLAHLLVAALGLALTFGSIARLLRAISMAGWLS